MTHHQITLTLTPEEYKLLGTALIELPYWKVAAIIAKMDAQVAQQQPNTNATQVLNEHNPS